MRLLIPFLLASLVTVAAADEAKKLAPAAQTHLDAGLKAYGEKQYEKAAKEFELAYQIDPDPSLLYAGAQALRLGNLCRKALQLYRKYLEAKLKPDQMTAAKTGLDLCEAKIAAEPKPPVAEPPKVEPPNAELPMVTIEPRPREAARWYRDPVGGALVIAGVIGVGVGVGFTVIASGTEKDAFAAEFRDDFASLLDKTTQQRRIGAVSLIAGGALVVGGVVAYVVRARGKKSVRVGTTGTSLFVAGSFR